MRDTLTVIASLLILVLAAALIGPPLVDWEARRGAVEGVIARATGAETHTEGALEIRLLPSPRVRIGGLRLGAERASEPSLRATGIEAEIGLTPLLRGEVRFTQVRVERAEIRLPHDEAGLRLQPHLLDESALRRDLAVDDLAIAQVVVVTTVPATGRTDQVQAEGVRLTARSLAGPWTVEGTAGSAPFRLSTGVLGPDRTVQARLSGGGNLIPRFDLDTRLSFVPDGAGALMPVAQGTARLFLGPPAQVAAAGMPLPVLVQATFRTGTDRIDLDPLSVEAGEGGASLRLAGTGAIRTDDPALQLKLEGRRLDIDSFILSPSGRAFMARSEGWQVPVPALPVALDLTINSLGLAQEELTNLVVRGSARRGLASLERFEVTAPGQTRLTLQGEARPGGEGGVGGRVSLVSEASDRLGRYLNRLGAPARLTAIMDGRRLEASAGFALGPPVTALRDVRIAAGEARVTGSLRYAAPEGGARGRLEAQIGMSGVDLGELPRVAEIFDTSRAVDVALALDARDVRHGGRPGAGRITARILSDGPSLAVEALEIADLAGAQASASGRIEPDGSGRITGRVSAPRAAPLVDLIGNVWIGGVSHLIPTFLREREIGLDIVAERARPNPASAQDAASAEPRLRTVARGTAAGGDLEVEAVTAEGRTQNLAVRIATANTGAWVDKPDLPLLRRPSVLELRGVRVVGGAFNVTASGDLGGVRVATTRPLVLGEADDVVEGGELDLTTPDVTPFLVLLGDGAGVAPPVPVQMRAAIGRDVDASLLALSGRVAGEAVSARLTVRSRADIAGEIGLDRVSLPWLATSLALNAGPDPNATAAWSSTRFGQSGRLFRGGTVQVAARRVALGRGLEAEEGRFTLVLTPDGLDIRDLAASLGGGRVAGTLRITRQDSLATINGEGRLDLPLRGLVPSSPFGGRLAAVLRLGGAGESMSAVVNNLGGSGEVGVAGFTAPEADPGALDRALLRLLADPDPLKPRRVETVVAEELARAPFTAAVVAAPAAVAGGVIRLNPVRAESGAATWRGAVALDLRTLHLEARGALGTAALPEGWLGAPPQVGLSWRGPVGAPVREVDAGALASGIAAVILQRELDQIDALQAEQRARSGERPGGADRTGAAPPLAPPIPSQPRPAPPGG